MASVQAFPWFLVGQVLCLSARPLGGGHPLQSLLISPQTIYA
jgi:hypothetical protein